MYSTCLCHTGQQLAGAGLFLHPHKTTLHFRERERETSLLPIADSTVSKDWFPHSFCLFYRLVPHISWTDFLINNCFPIYGLPTVANEFAMLNILRNVSKVQ